MSSKQETDGASVTDSDIIDMVEDDATPAPEGDSDASTPETQDVDEQTSEDEQTADDADETGIQTTDLGDEDLDSEDSLTFSNGVIEKIVAIAVRDVPGVLGMRGGFINRVQETFGANSPTKGVSVEVTADNAVRVNISVLIEYGSYAPQVFEDVKRAVVKHVTGMTGLGVAGVNLRIEDVLTAEEVAATKRGARAEEDDVVTADPEPDAE
jgi:uncharacterized alkaline shock family protein YloU